MASRKPPTGGSPPSSERVRRAALFLSTPVVGQLGWDEKRAFLLTKGVQPEEVEEAIVLCKNQRRLADNDGWLRALRTVSRLASLFAAAVAIRRASARLRQPLAGLCALSATWACRVRSLLRALARKIVVLLLRSRTLRSIDVRSSGTVAVVDTEPSGRDRDAEGSSESVTIGTELRAALGAMLGSDSSETALNTLQAYLYSALESSSASLTACVVNTSHHNFVRTGLGDECRRFLLAAGAPRDLRPREARPQFRRLTRNAVVSSAGFQEDDTDEGFVVFRCAGAGGRSCACPQHRLLGAAEHSLAHRLAPMHP